MPLRGKLDLWLFAFLLLYFIRLLYDFNFNVIPGNKYALQYFSIAVLVPVLAVSIGRFPKTTDLSIGKMVLCLGTLVAALTLAAEMLGLAYNPWEDQGVLNVRLGFEALNPITLGHTGVITMMCSLYLLGESGQSKAWRIIASLALLLGSAVVVKAGSRGALIALALCTIWFGTARPARFVFIIPLFLIALIFGVTQTDVVKHTIDTIFGGGWVYDGSSLTRLEVQASAWADFKSAPLIGQHFASPFWDEGYHPHNLLIETAMALGVIGLILFAIIFVRVVRSIFTNFNREHPLLTLLLIGQTVNAALSAALWGADALYALVAICLAGQYSSSSTDSRRRINQTGLTD